MSYSGSSSGSYYSSAEIVPVAVVRDYYKDDMKRYDCPITAILRELLQNSVDAIDRMGGGKSVSSSSSGFEGVVRISISTLGEDITYGGKTVANAGDLAVRFSDNGIGITPDVMETLLVSVGGSDKQGRNQNKAGASERGGFGAAKNLIFFAQKFYIVESAHAETGDWFQMRGSKNKHDKKAKEVGGSGHGTSVFVVLADMLQKKKFDCEDFISSKIKGMTPKKLAKIWAYEIERSSVPYVRFVLSYESTSADREDSLSSGTASASESSISASHKVLFSRADLDHDEEHAREEDGEWILYKNQKPRDRVRSVFTCQVLGIHMFSMALQTLRSDFDLVLDIQRNSKRHLSQHRDSLKNATEEAFEKTLKTLDKSRGHIIDFQAKGGDANIRQWKEKVEELIERREERDSLRNHQEDAKLKAAIEKAAEELAGTVSHQQSRQIEQVMTEVRKDDHKVELAEKTKKTIESILTDLDVGYKVLSVYGRRRMPQDWLNPDALSRSKRVYLKTIRMVLDTIFEAVGGKYLVEYDIGLIFTPSPSERKRIGGDPREKIKTDTLAECRTVEGSPPTIFFNPIFDHRAHRKKGTSLALKMERRYAARNVFYLWTLACHEAAHMFDDEDDVLEHGEDFAAERDRIQIKTTHKVSGMIRRHLEILSEESSGSTESDPEPYFFRCVDCDKYRRVPSRQILTALGSHPECDDNFWNLDEASHSNSEEPGLRARVGSSFTSFTTSYASGTGYYSSAYSSSSGPSVHGGGRLASWGASEEWRSTFEGKKGKKKRRSSSSSIGSYEIWRTSTYSYTASSTPYTFSLFGSSMSSEARLEEAKIRQKRKDRLAARKARKKARRDAKRQDRGKKKGKATGSGADGGGGGGDNQAAEAQSAAAADDGGRGCVVM